MSQTQCHSQFLWKSIGHTLCLTILRDSSDRSYIRIRARRRRRNRGKSAFLAVLLSECVVEVLSEFGVSTSVQLKSATTVIVKETHSNSLLSHKLLNELRIKDYSALIC